MAVWIEFSLLHALVLVGLPRGYGARDALRLDFRSKAWPQTARKPTGRMDRTASIPLLAARSAAADRRRLDNLRAMLFSHGTAGQFMGGYGYAMYFLDAAVYPIRRIALGGVEASLVAAPQANVPALPALSAAVLRSGRRIDSAGWIARLKCGGLPYGFAPYRGAKVCGSEKLRISESRKPWSKSRTILFIRNKVSPDG